MLVSAVAELTGWPLIEVITSPVLIPAAAAGPVGITWLNDGAPAAGGVVDTDAEERGRTDVHRRGPAAGPDLAGDGHGAY